MISTFPQPIETPSLSPKQVAKAIGVSESSLKRWCDQGRIRFRKTAGGHRRIYATSVIEFLSQTGHPIVRPEILGLALEPTTSSSIEEVSSNFLAALLEGNERRARRIVVDLFLQKVPVSEIGDRLIAPTFQRIGRFTSCGEIETFHERRACEIAKRLVDEIQMMISQPDGGPLAIGGSLLHDHYALPSALVETVMRQRGWCARDMGTNLPLNSLSAAVVDLQPKLVWISLSHIAQSDQFVREYLEFQASVPPEVLIVVGGRALVPEIRNRIRFSASCETLTQLESFVDTLNSNQP
ncbi:MAG TPA: excisionase family DNA-binding protein [Pirellulaceae bacterium]|nr:excisionase family DNA-binding protein [Pirellulaceae bacterium]HMO91682.1 excisionase family DNA-binding protein [Pirellulaceae bacterium]HMP68379.1 excisionase family DNA-binding protein [Pirellulaceae bacterium]